MARRGDGLSEYRAKRDFTATSEPAGAVAPRDSDTPRFVVQEHRARALHWDLRLERDGALVSWAVPKGIPADPRKNHLAVRTEDHPLEYLTFAGEIPAGQYGAGTMRVYDTGTYETEKFDDTEVMVTFHGERVRGRYVLFRTRGKDWMIHRMDPPDDPDRELPPADLRPMLASTSTRAIPSDGWAWELKWDGIRALGYVDGGRLSLFSRNGNEVTARYPELRPLGVEFGTSDAVVDGEIVAFDDDGRPSFERLQSRMHVTSDTAIRKLARETPVAYVLFDLLWLDGHSLMSEPYEVRRQRLLALGLAGSNWQTPPHEVGDGSSTREVSVRFGIEGVVAKKLDSIYEPGRRSRGWVKQKNSYRQEFVVGGYMPGEKGRTGSIGSLLLGYYTPDDPPRLHYAGRAGSGLSQHDISELERVFARCARDTSPFDDGTPPKTARFVEPILVVEVKFTEWTNAGVVRHPIFLGFRTDKDATEVVREND
ncbi:MAG: non-homologous end-joining DNA ligase [Actinomycetota bacterium]|nr:non-homologous end-joining DNA ligase [Actinomycetota bacterium]